MGMLLKHSSAELTLGTIKYIFAFPSMPVWCTEDKAPVEGMGLSGWPAHAQECDMESRGSLNWETLSQAGVVGVDVRDWHHRALAREMCVCPESTGGFGADSGCSALSSGIQECVWLRDRDLERGLCTGRGGRDNNMPGGNEVSGWTINNTFSIHLPYFHASNGVLLFPRTPVLSCSTDIVLTLRIGNEESMVVAQTGGNSHKT